MLLSYNIIVNIIVRNAIKYMIVFFYVGKKMSLNSNKNTHNLSSMKMNFNSHKDS